MLRKNICMLVIVIYGVFQPMQAMNPRTGKTAVSVGTTIGMIDKFKTAQSHSGPAAKPAQKVQIPYQRFTEQSSPPQKNYTPPTMTFNKKLVPAQKPETVTLDLRLPQSQQLIPVSKTLTLQKNSLPGLKAFFNHQESLKTAVTPQPVLQKKRTSSPPVVQPTQTIHPKNSLAALEKRALRAEKKNINPNSLDISNNLEQMNSPQALQKRQQRAENKKSQQEINPSNNLEYSNSPIPVAKRKERSEKKSEINYTNNNENLYHRKSAQEKINIKEASIRGTVNKVSQEIDTWLKDYADPTSEFYQDLTSNNATQEILKDKILNLVRTKDSNNNYSNPDPAIIKKLQEKYSKNLNKQYSKNSNVLDVLKSVSDQVHKDTSAQQPIAREANSVVSQYTTSPHAQDTVFSFMGVQPTFDKFGKPTNFPSVEKIIQKTRGKKADQQSYDSLQSTLQAVEVGLATVKGDALLTKQLQTFQKDITKELSNQKFKKFETISEQLTSALPSKNELLGMTSVGNMTITQAVDALSKTLKENPMITVTTSVASAIGLTPEAFLKKTGLQDMTILEFAEKTKIIKKEPQVRPIQSTDQLLSKFEIYQQKEAMKPIQQANELVGRYYSSKQILAITNNSPTVNQSTRAVTNIPSVETLINNAITNPTEKNYLSLESARKAIKTAQIASKKDPAMTQQLQLMDQQITTAISHQALTPYQSWSTYLSSFTPSTKTVLTKTGIGDVKLSQVADIGKTATQKAYSWYEKGVKWGIIPEKTIQELIR